MEPDAQASKRFILTAAIFEASLTIVAIGLGWCLDQPPCETLDLEPSAFFWGLAATIPPLLMFWLCIKLPYEPFRKIVRLLTDSVIPWFRSCSWIDLAIIAFLAGLGEEMLFRGVLQAAIANEIGEPFGIWGGLLITSMLFGMLHSMTPMYAILACLISLFFGWIWLLSGNLLTPITAHAVYDFMALAYFVRNSRSLFQSDSTGQ